MVRWGSGWWGGGGFRVDVNVLLKFLGKFKKKNWGRESGRRGGGGGWGRERGQGQGGCE